jgi:hypothetical protein
MANDNRYLEVIKRLLSAETYFRSREEAKARDAGHSAPTETPKTRPS